MAQSVDTKIVELKFNNDNFAEKVDSTLTKLEQLNKDIEKVGFTEAFKNLGKSVKDVDTKSITEGVQETQKAFSKMEVVGMTALVNLSNAAVNFGKKMVKSLVSPITQGVLQGGLARARNIEQATFQFEGQKIGKSAGNESLSYYKEVMDAVLGTSYSYDVAAKAASQLAASNVGVIETERKLADGSTITAKTLDGGMTKALLGIAGVASMTGSDFDSISQIFTRVAGQGRVMANDLNSIASRGLNAAAVLANYLGKTEEEVRDMVTKGKVSFEDFSNAMSEAFGSHAKDSTLMFQGAMDDVNAALARIGADFYGPMLTAGRDILNSITPLVDVIHSKLNPALSSTTNLITDITKKATQYLDMLSYMLNLTDKNSTKESWIDEHMNAWTNIADLYKKGDVKSAIDGLEKASAAWKGMGGEGINGRQMVADYYSLASNAELLAKGLDISKEKAQELIDEGKVGAKEIDKAVGGLVDKGVIGFNEFYKSFHKLWSESDKLMNIGGVTKFFDDYVQSCIAAGQESDRFGQHIKTFFSIYNGLASLFSSLKTIAGGLLDIFMTLVQHLAPLGKLVIDLAAATAQFVVGIADAIATSETFSNVIDSVVNLLLKLFDALHLNKVAEFALGGITKAFDLLANAIERIHDGLGKVVTTFNNVIGKIIDKILEIISNTETLQKLLTSIRNAGITVMLIQLIGALTKPAELLAAFSKSVKDVGKSFGDLIKSIGDVFSSIAGMVGKIGDVLDEVTNSLKRMQELIVATAILEIAFAIAVLAGALYLLSTIKAQKAADNLMPLIDLAGIVGSLIGIMAFVAKASKGIFNKFGSAMKDVANAFLEFALAILIIAGAMKLLSTIKTDDMMAAFAVVEVLMLTMAAIAKLLQGKTTKDTGLKALWSGKKTSTDGMMKGLMGLVAMAEAVKIVSKALVNIAQQTDKDAVWNAVAIIELVMWSMAAIAKWLSDEKAPKMTKGIGGLLAMALAIKLLAKPIAALTELASQNNEALWSAVASIGVLMAVMTGLLTWLAQSKGNFGDAMSLLLVAAAIKILGNTLKELAEMAQLDNTALWSGLGIIALGLGAMVLALDLLDGEKLIGKSIALIAVAYSLKLLSETILAFSAAGDSAWNGLGVLAVSLLSLFIAVELFSKAPIGGILKLFLTLALGAIIVAGFGAAIGVFGVGISLFGAGLTSLASGCQAVYEVLPAFLIVLGLFIVSITVLATVGAPALIVILGIAAAFLLLGAGMALLGSGLQHIAAAIKLMADLEGKLGSTAKNIRAFVKELTKMKSDAQTVNEAATSIAQAFSQIGNAALKAKVNTTAFNTVGLQLATNLAKGIQQGSAKVISTVTAMSNTAIANLRGTRSNWYSIGSYLIAGMVSGIASQQSSLESQVRSLEAKAERAVRAKAKIKSPSRVWMQIGSYMGEGLAIGIRKSGSMVESASKGLAEVSEDAVTSAITAISNAMDTEMNDDFVITPVVDLSNVTDSARYINSRFGSMGIGANLAGAISSNIQNGGKDTAINKLANKIDAMTETMNSRALNNYITIDGTGDPEAFADGLIRSFKLNARTT